MTKQLLTLEQVSDRTGIPLETFRHWRKRERGEGPKTFRLGRRVVVAEDDLDAWINAHREAAEPQGVA